METLKKDILDTIKPVMIEGDWYVLEAPICADSINEALQCYGNVMIPYIGKPIVLDKPIRLSSNQHLKVDPEQILRQDADSHTCLVRNEHLQDGALGVTDPGKRDRNLSIEGGIWNIKPHQKCYTDQEKSMVGSHGNIILCGVEQVSLKNMQIFDHKDCGMGAGGSSYGIQICDCKDFVVENIDFHGNGRDGVHLNGPAQNGYIKHIRGKEMGDDMVALNAWDWRESALTFGTIERVVIEDVEGSGNELRLLPGQKVYESGVKVDCDIRNCVYENITGAYTIKLYAQPNIFNAMYGTNDVSGTVGTIDHVYFKNIRFSKVTASGFNNLPVKSLFEICADCSDLYLQDIYIQNTIEECNEMDVRLINVGPLSAVWTNGSDDPADWGEVFDPDAICKADRISLENIDFKGNIVTDPEKLVREVHMQVNPDYPNTTPRGGTGYGTIGDVWVR